MKNEKIYGVSSKYNAGRWDCYVVVFDDQKQAEEWLNTEEYDFRERELMSRAKAERLAGKKAVNEATDIISLMYAFVN